MKTRTMIFLFLAAIYLFQMILVAGFTVIPLSSRKVSSAPIKYQVYKEVSIVNLIPLLGLLSAILLDGKFLQVSYQDYRKVSRISPDSDLNLNQIEHHFEAGFVTMTHIRQVLACFPINPPCGGLE